MKKLIIAIMIIATILALASCESKDYSLKDYAAEEPVASTMVIAEEPVAITIPDKIDLPYLPYTYLEEPVGTAEAQRYAASGMLPEEIAVDKATEFYRECGKPYAYTDARELRNANSFYDDGELHRIFIVDVVRLDGTDTVVDRVFVRIDYAGGNIKEVIKFQ